jgi:hypothetical protein
MEDKSKLIEVKVSAVIELGPGQEFRVSDKDDVNFIVFGRDPTASYSITGRMPQVDIVPGVLPVKLLESSHTTTSRQQFEIKTAGGVFAVSNLSREALHLDGLDGVIKGSYDLPVGQETIAANKATYAQFFG